MSVSDVIPVHVEAESTPQRCGYDYDWFVDGFDCDKPTEAVVIEDDTAFHTAHLCWTHADECVRTMVRLGWWSVNPGPR